MNFFLSFRFDSYVHCISRKTFNKLPITRTFFQFPVIVRVIGSRLYLLVVLPSSQFSFDKTLKYDHSLIATRQYFTSGPVGLTLSLRIELTYPCDHLLGSY